MNKALRGSECPKGKAHCEYHELVNYESDMQLEEAASWAESNFQHIPSDFHVSYEERTAVAAMANLNELANCLNSGPNSEDQKVKNLAAQLKEMAAKLERHYE